MTRMPTYIPHHTISISNSVRARFAQTERGDLGFTVIQSILGAAPATRDGGEGWGWEAERGIYLEGHTRTPTMRIFSGPSE